MSDTLVRLFTLPILTDAIAGGVVAGAVWWKFYRFNLAKAWNSAIDTQTKAVTVLKERADKQIKEGLASGNALKVVGGYSDRYVASNSTGPLYVAGAFIQNGIKGLFNK